MSQPQIWWDYECRFRNGDTAILSAQEGRIAEILNGDRRTLTVFNANGEVIEDVDILQSELAWLRRTRREQVEEQITEGLIGTFRE
jgi:Na+-transporting NADH:ubiquinone oxidoreductase subunit NqrA